MRTQRYLKNVSTLRLDTSLCTGCGLCLDVCPHGVFILNHRRAEIAERDSCMECGACALNCPVSAIQVRSGVGCATALIEAAIRKTDPECTCCQNSSSSSCC